MAEPRKPRRGVIAMIVLAIILIPVGATLWPLWRTSVTAADAADGDAPPEPEPEPEPKRIRVAVAAAGSMDAPTLSTRYRGDVRARRSSDLAFRRDGRLRDVHVHEGDVVKTGDVLAELDTSDLDVAAERTAAEVQAANAALDEAIAGPRYQTLRAAAAVVRQLDAQLQSAQERLSREERLRDRGAGSSQALDDSKYDVQRLTAAVAAEKSRLDELEEGTRSEQITAARANLAMAQAQRDQIGVDRQDSTIVAPYDGIVAGRLFDEGAIVGPDQVVLSLVEVSPLEARFGLPADVAMGLDIGQSVSLELPQRAGDAPITGRIVRMQPRVDPITRTRSVDVQFDPDLSSRRVADQTALIGQTATLRLPWHAGDSGDGLAAFWVPSDSLVRGSRGLWSVYVTVPDANVQTDMPPESMQTEFAAIVERRDVRVLRTAGPVSLVAGMVQLGEPIIVIGPGRVGPGVLVQSVLASPGDLTKIGMTGRESR